MIAYFFLIGMTKCRGRSITCVLLRLLRGQELDKGRPDEALPGVVEMPAVVRQGRAHDLDFLAVVCDRFFGLKRGEVEKVVLIEFLAQIVVEFLALRIVGKDPVSRPVSGFSPMLSRRSAMRSAERSPRQTLWKGETVAGP